MIVNSSTLISAHQFVLIDLVLIETFGSLKGLVASQMIQLKSHSIYIHNLFVVKRGNSLVRGNSLLLGNSMYFSIISHAFINDLPHKTIVAYIIVVQKSLLV